MQLFSFVDCTCSIEKDESYLHGLRGPFLYYWFFFNNLHLHLCNFASWGMYLWWYPKIHAVQACFCQVVCLLVSLSSKWHAEHRNVDIHKTKLKSVNCRRAWASQLSVRITFLLALKMPFSMISQNDSLLVFCDSTILSHAEVWKVPCTHKYIQLCYF